MYYDVKDSGERIRDLRKEMGWTQEVLADKAGVSREYLGKIEKGHNGASVDLLVTLCGLFNTTLDYLVLGRKPIVEEIQKKEALQDIVNRLQALI